MNQFFKLKFGLVRTFLLATFVNFIANFHKLLNKCLGCFPLRTVAFTTGISATSIRAALHLLSECLLYRSTASASSGSKNRFLQRLQTRAFSAGVNGSPLQTTAVNSDNTCYPTLSQRRKYTESAVYFRSGILHCKF